MDMQTIAIIVLIVVLLIVILALIEENKKKNAEIQRKINEYEKIMYRYQNAEGKSIDKYLETPEQRLFRIYRALSYKSKQKLVDYAETLERREKE
ncbi:hypothetical protein [Huintestinicola sp.]